MIGRPPRMLSQRNYQALMALRENAARIRQQDQGLAYRRHATARTRDGREVPLHVGPAIEAMRVEGDRFEA